MLTLSKSKMVKAQATANEITNLYRNIFVFDKKIGKNNNSYPIKIPIQAVNNQEKLLVYTAQANKRRQMDR